jgi:hypothetical protein
VCRCSDGLAHEDQDRADIARGLPLRQQTRNRVEGGGIAPLALAAAVEIEGSSPSRTASSQQALPTTRRAARRVLKPFSDIPTQPEGG